MDDFSSFKVILVPSGSKRVVLPILVILNPKIEYGIVPGPERLILTFSQITRTIFCRLLGIIEKAKSLPVREE
jgi:hypothetical protein